MAEKINFKEFWEETKKDKKKLFMIVLLPLVLIISILCGFFFNKNNSNETEKVEVIDPLVVPIDSTMINSNSKIKKTQIYNNDFFNDSEPQKMSEDEYVEPVEISGNGNKNISKVVKKESNSYKYTSPYEEVAREEKSRSVAEKPNVVVVEEPTKKRRNPSDSYGNMVTKGGLSKSMYAAVISNDNKAIKQGSAIRIRVGEDIFIEDLKVPKNSTITGYGTIVRDRMHILISSIKIGSVVKNVNWEVVDEDGNIGVFIPPSVMNNIAKDAAGTAINEGGSAVETKVPYIGSVKLNLSKKNQETEFVISTGHKVYLRKK